MRIKQEVNDLPLLEIDEYTSGRCIGARNGDMEFEKLVLFYKHGKPVWVHKDYVMPEPARSGRKSRKNSKKNT